MTLTKYEQLRAYWFNPKEKTVTLKVRDFRDYGTFKDRDFILCRLQEASSRLKEGPKDS